MVLGSNFLTDVETLAANLTFSLGSYWIKGDIPVKKTLPIIKQLEEDTPLMQTIWQNSSFALQGRDRIIKMILEFGKDLQDKLTRGEITEESVYNPPFQI